MPCPAGASSSSDNPSSNEFEESVIDARRCNRHDLHRTAVIGRTDVKNLIFGWVGEPKHLVDIFRNLPKRYSLARRFSSVCLCVVTSRCMTTAPLG
jgi:hypothetical protein